MLVNEKQYQERVYEIVRQIPFGKVMTYGQIAEILGQGYTPRTVGYAMNASSKANVPWQRVINAKGGCSTAKITFSLNVQQAMLEEEGVTFNERGFCDLAAYRWHPEGIVIERDQPTLFGA